MRGRQRLSGAWPRLKPHLPWLGVVLALTAVGQWFELHDGITAIISSDGFVYMRDAAALPATQGLVDPTVPPGYPIFLAAIFLVAGRDNVLAVLAVQTVLLITEAGRLARELISSARPRRVPPPA